MNAAPAEFCGWTRRGFWCVCAILFAAQAGLILLFAESGGAARKLPPPGDFRLVGTPLNADLLTKTFFATDPIVFPLPSMHGFSQRAWLSAPEQHFDVPAEVEAPAWLAADVSRLGTNFPRLAPDKSPLPFGLADRSDSELVAPQPIFLAPDDIRNQSVFEIAGELSGRLLNAPVNLRSWPSSQVLSNSVVQIAVNGAGQVVASRLLGRSGLLDADTNAVGVARSLRFRPASVRAPVWGRAVFEWETLEQTNSAPAGPL